MTDEKKPEEEMESLVGVGVPPESGLTAAGYVEAGSGKVELAPDLERIAGDER